MHSNLKLLFPTAQDKNERNKINGVSRPRLDDIPLHMRNPVVVLEREAPTLLRKSFVNRSVLDGSFSLRNEEEEKRRRAQQRLSAAHGTPMQTPAHNRRGVSANSPARALTTAQLKEQYGNCIKLAHANKINVKNAFSLNIIDYMSVILRSNDLTFTLATNTLDAGTKVYVSRVDAVHQEAQKVANGLVMAMDNKAPPKESRDSEEEENEDVMNESGDQQKRAKKKKEKKRRKIKTIAAPETLNSTKAESTVEIDPVLHKLTTGHDMGNVNGLFLANLRASINGELFLDAASSIDAMNKPIPRSTTVTVDVSCFADVNKLVLEKKPKICPKLAAFVFCNREEGIGVDILRQSDRFGEDTSHRSEFTFDIDAEVPKDDPVDDAKLVDHMELFDGLENDDGDDAFVGTLDFDDDDDNDNHEVVTRKSIIKALNLESLPDLARILAERPDDYTYFDKKIIGSWAGPAFWRQNVWHKLQRREPKPADQIIKREKKKFGKFLIDAC